MKIISHRGNLHGPDPTKENTPQYILNALEQGIDCEIDLWLVDDSLYTGHDEPKNLISREFIYDERLWIHAKNLEALHFLNKTCLHYFWHEKDRYTLTSKNYIWTYPGEETCDRSIIVQLDSVNNVPMGCYGICTDYVSKKK